MGRKGGAMKPAAPTARSLIEKQAELVKIQNVLDSWDAAQKPLSPLCDVDALNAQAAQLREQIRQEAKRIHFEL